MPETRGRPEEEPTRANLAASIATNFIAGQGVVRRILLYVIVGLSLATFGGLFAAVGLAALILLCVTDGSLS